MNLSDQDRQDIETLLKRKPTKVEEHIFDVMWSEHCSYKSTKDVLKQHIPTKGSDVVLGIGEDAGIVKFTEFEGKKYAIVVAHESHNHPSQILPTEGAATGVGGVVRDVYCMGADVIGVLDSLHFGIDTTGANLAVDEIAEGVVFGVSDYANPLGVPVLGGETIYHPTYNDNCLVNVAALGIIEEDDVIRSRVPRDADTVQYDVILVGKSTDTTGFGGASFASATLDSANETTNVGAVQVHDPFLKRVLVEAIKKMFRVVKSEKIKIGFKDLGAGGIACATSEIAAAGGFGVELQLDQVNTIHASLAPEIIACAETQERFCIAVPQDKSKRICDIFNIQYELPKIYHNAGAVVVGKVIKDPFYTINWKGEQVCRLPIEAITTEVRCKRVAAEKVVSREAKPNLPQINDFSSLLTNILKEPNICSKRYVYRHYDNAVRGDTVIYPGEADSVVITPIKGCSVGMTVNISSNLYGAYDPYMTGAYAVAEAIRNITAVGGEPLALTDCLNYGNPEKPEAFFEFCEGVKGLSDAARALSTLKNEPIPIISGNVSLYNESKQGSSIIPSPVIVVVGKVADYHKAPVMQAFNPDLHLIVVGNRYPEFGGTQITHLIPNLGNTAPQVRFEEEKRANTCIYQLIQDQKLAACHDISMGGLWVSLCEMLLGERGNFKIGAIFSVPEGQDPIPFLFSENGGYLIAVAEENLCDVSKTLTQANLYFADCGKTLNQSEIQISLNNAQMSISMDKIRDAWLVKIEP